MKYLVVSCLLFLYTLQLSAQQEYFLYLQTDNSQPFYVRLNNNVYYSSSSGFLILPKLPENSLLVTIGLPHNVAAEHDFNIPVIHKDAGFVLKMAGDDSWQMINLQTPSIAINGTMQEKKNAEITGTRKSDAFTMLLANAVNDTAVLYTVVRPPKPAPPPVVKTDVPAKDTAARITKAAPQKQKNGTVKRPPVTKDSTVVVRVKHPVVKHPAGKPVVAPSHQPVNVAKNTAPPPDSQAVTKTAPPVVSTNTKPPVLLHDSTKKLPFVQKEKRDTVAVASSGKRTLREALGLTKPKKVRKDTIIMLTGTHPRSAAPVTTPPVSEHRVASRDTTQVIKKEILQAPEEKRDALLNNKESVVLEKVTVKKDTLASGVERTRDSLEIITRTDPVNPPSVTPDTAIRATQKRMRPLVTKAAELLTDTSYIAVYVDESKDKFDTIRISIPFNELANYRPSTRAVSDSPQQRITPKSVDTVVSKPAAQDSTAHKDTSATNAKADSSTHVAAPTSTADEKQKTSSVDTSAARPFAPTPISEAKPVDTVTVTHRRDSVVSHAAPDTSSARHDSLPAAKASAQPLYLNSDCKEVAVDADVDKLRIRMLVVESDDERIGVAKRLFKQKCVLVKHVRALSELFKTDEGKYKWFDAAYPFVSDTGNFSSLGELIHDEYYLNRFKAMLRH